jgi:hypothetical protein
LLTTARIGEIVKRHRPRGWRVRESKHRFKVNSGLADHNRRTLYVPTLIDESALFVFLHECGHVKHRHFDSDVKQPIHRDEFEAEQYAIHVFKNEELDYRANCFRVRGNVCAIGLHTMKSTACRFRRMCGDGQNDKERECRSRFTLQDQ